MSEISKRQMILTCLLGVIATVGVARFAYTPMIPVMAQQLGMTDDVAGYLAAANYAGYLCGTLSILFLSSLSLKARLFKLGLLLAVVTSSLMAFTTSEWVWAFLRFLSGLSSATGMLCGAGLLMHWLMKRNHRAVLGVFFSGLGIGIVITAITAKLVDTSVSWQLQWHLYALITLLLVLPVFKWLPDFSNEQPLVRAKQAGVTHSRWFMPVMQLCYFCSGIGYVVSATFLMAIAESTEELQGNGWVIWLITGIACSQASGLWDRVTAITGQWIALSIAFILKAISLLILIISQDLVAVLLSALLYGGSFIGIVSMVMSMVGRLFPDNPSKPMSRLTLSYGVAQIIAPAVVGYMASYYGNFTNGLILTLLVVILGMGLLLVAWQIEAKQNQGVSREC